MRPPSILRFDSPPQINPPETNASREASSRFRYCYRYRPRKASFTEELELRLASQQPWWPVVVGSTKQLQKSERDLRFFPPPPPKKKTMEEAASSWHYDEHPDIIRLVHSVETNSEVRLKKNGKTGTTERHCSLKVPCRSSIHRLTRANREKNLG